jgi:hypothetical protein
MLCSLCSLPPGKAEVALVVPHSNTGLNAAVAASAFRQLPPLGSHAGYTLWSQTFRSSSVPAVQVVESASGDMVCWDAIPFLKRHDAALTFPWQTPRWADLLDDCFAAAIERPENNDAPARASFCPLMSLRSIDLLLCPQAAVQSGWGHLQVFACWRALLWPPHKRHLSYDAPNF